MFSLKLFNVRGRRKAMCNWIMFKSVYRPLCWCCPFLSLSSSLSSCSPSMWLSFEPVLPLLPSSAFLSLLIASGILPFRGGGTGERSQMTSPSGNVRGTSGSLWNPSLLASKKDLFLYESLSVLNIKCGGCCRHRPSTVSTVLANSKIVYSC